ncbi:MAG: 6-phosphogluconolactonase [Burkholderiaceae bacterium]
MADLRFIERPAPELADRLADDVASWLADAIAARGAASLVVPGGSTPGPFLEALASRGIDWSRVSIVASDERRVPLDSPRSNEAMIRARLLRGPAAAAKFVSLLPGGEDEAALARVADRVRGLLPFDVCVLGMGEDGHTASLFPAADRLAEALADDAPAVLAIRAPGAPEARLSLSASVLRDAGHVCLLLAGAAKRGALDSALRPGPVAEMPVRAILARSGPVCVYWSP